EKLVEKARDGYIRLTAFAKQVRKGEQTVALDLGNGMMLDMVLIPDGTFTMGSPENEEDRSVTLASPEDEKDRWVKEKQHEVTIAQSFYMGKFDVTQEQYEAVMGTNPSYFKGRPTNPVEQVNWFEAVGFC